MCIVVSALTSFVKGALNCQDLKLVVDPVL
jgi:hypothetical protein